MKRARHPEVSGLTNNGMTNSESHMKSKTLNIFTILFISILFLTSCADDEAVLIDEISTESVQKSTEIDVVSDNLSSIIETVYILEEGLGTPSKDNPFLPECLTKTIVISGNMRTVTLDFGEGCDMPNGNHLSGIVTISYIRDPAAHSRTITYSLSNFYFNYINIAGGGSVFRELANDDGNPQSTNNQDITVTWPNEFSAQRVGVMVSEWVEGFDTPLIWGDNVFSITGNWSTEFSNDDINTGIVTTALRRELVCRFIGSGIITLTYNSAVGTLDFGDGTCDNEAIFTGPNGVEHIIILH